MANGYIGRFLRVNLSRMKAAVEPLREGLARNYIGGAGIGIRLLFDEVKRGVEPLSSENALCIFTGPFQGTLVPTSGRFHVTTKSPLTGLVGDANSGGHFGAYLKYAGYDGIVIQGVAEKPVYLWIDDGNVEIKDAKHLWGKNTFETEEIIKEELGDKDIKICSIGPAGENLVKIACIMNDLDRTPARTGNGAVMGSKKLKAIAVRGDFNVGVSNPDRLYKVTSDLLKRIYKNPDVPSFRKYGTVRSVTISNEEGNLPTKNWLRNRFDEGAEDIGGETIYNTILLKSRACFGCPMGCGRYINLRSGPYKGAFSGGPEYESAAALGSLCMNRDLYSMAYANILCNLYGMDTISVGNVVAFAMECYENGLLTKSDTGGIELTWGNGEAEVKLVEMIAKREGIGNILAEGVKKAAEFIGKGAEKFAIHVKGLELPMHEPRGAPGLALGYATSTRGACHLRTLIHAYEIWNISFGLPLPEKGDRFSIKGKACLLTQFQNQISLMNSLVYCIFATEFSFTYKDWVDMLNAVTGWEITFEETMKIGERIWNLQKLFNIREGTSRKDDTLPQRIMRHPLPYQPAKGRVAPDLEPLLDEYYHLRGWDKEGTPTKEKLIELGLLGGNTT